MSQSCNATVVIPAYNEEGYIEKCLRSIAASLLKLVIASPRRFEINPREFVDGTAYEGPFEKVDVVSPAPDITEEEFPEYYKTAKLRLCIHYAEKPILIEPTLLKNPTVRQLFGEKLINKIVDWIKSHRAPNFFNNRNAFIQEYLRDCMHTKTPEEIQSSFLEGYQSIRKLSNIELQSLFPFILARQIWYMGSFKAYIDLIGEKYYDDEYWDRMIRTLGEWLANAQKEFLSNYAITQNLGRRSSMLC